MNFINFDVFLIFTEINISVLLSTEGICMFSELNTYMYIEIK